jgi:hypothetical protein
MIDFRLYRLAFIPALLAAVIGAFSLAPIPSPLTVGATTQVFDLDGATSATRKLIREAPDRLPGSDGDRAAGAYVKERFQALGDGKVTSQTFDGPGNSGTLENVVLGLPGTTNRTVLLLAGRDSQHQPAAASSAAATGLLIEIAGELTGSDHAANLVIASVDGSTLGGAGTKQLIDGLPDGETIDAAIVLSQPGSAALAQPFLVSSSASTDSASAQLAETAAALLGKEGDIASTREGALGGLARLAFPSGLGEQAPLIARGIDAIALSSAGEAPLPAGADQEDDLGTDSIAAIGRTAIALVGAVDQASRSPDHGPGTYVYFAGNLVPGWSLALLALTLLIPPLAVAATELARQSRRRGGLAPIAIWAARCVLPPLAALVAIYGLALVGIIPSPPFPFDPGVYGVGGSELLAIAFLLALIAAVGYFERIWRRPPGAGRQPLAATAGVLGVLACLVAWAGNPYLALLLAPLSHVWIAACRRPRGGAFTLLVAIICTIPLLAAIASVGSALDWGSSAPWQLVLLFSDGQIGLLAGLSFVLMAGALAACCVALRSDPLQIARRRPPGEAASSEAQPSVKPPNRV